jgi:hypothetical protein
MNRPMYEHFAARHLAVKGPGALTSIEEGVMGTLPLDMSSDPAYWFIQGIHTFAVHITTSAVAGQYSKVGLSIENASEQVLGKILGVFVRTPTTGAVGIWRCARTAFSSDPGVYGVGTDTRIAEARPSVAIGISQEAASAGSGTKMGEFNLNTEQLIPSNMPLIFSPEQCITFNNQTANQAIEATLIWAEIPAYKGEL